MKAISHLTQILNFDWHIYGWLDFQQKYMKQQLLTWINTFRPWQNGPHFTDDIFKCIFLNENLWVSVNVSLKFVPKGQINNIPALVLIMAWRRIGDKPLYEPMMISLLMHIFASFGLNNLTLIPVWISNHNHYKVWDQITYLSQTSVVAPLKFGKE